MRARIFMTTVICTIALAATAQKKFDSTMKVGKAGFRVFCANKNPEKNIATISPVGFDKDAHEVSFEIKGRVTKAEVDDLNGDGFPDLVVYVYNGGDKRTGTVIGVSSDKNQGFGPIYFPDITDDMKLRVGYVGYDEFTLMEGNLMRRFPVYSTADSANIKPTGVIRQVMYRVVPGDKPGIQKFKVTRSYELGKPNNG
ncbi:MAG: hypothetical protein JO301_17595 [Chitinophagaceae bacterium]|nr:hypothetical protein [Chitinophagaceae bacterium]